MALYSFSVKVSTNLYFFFLLWYLNWFLSLSDKNI
jgi:hypothetical protein